VLNCYFILSPLHIRIHLYLNYIEFTVIISVYFSLDLCHCVFPFHLFQIDYIEIFDYNDKFNSFWVPQKVWIEVFHRSETDFYLFNNNDKQHFGDIRRYYPQGQSDLYLSKH